MLASPESCPALDLNADVRPLSCLPLSLRPSREAAGTVFLVRADAFISLDTAKNIVSPYVQRHSRATQYPLEGFSVVKRKFDYSRFGGVA